MIKKEFIELFVEELKAEGVVLTAKDAGKALTAYENAIKKGLKKDGKIQFVGFGTFETKERAAREGRNPRTDEVIQIPAKTVPTFKPGKQFKEEF